MSLLFVIKPLMLTVESHNRYISLLWFVLGEMAKIARSMVTTQRPIIQNSPALILLNERLLGLY